MLISGTRMAMATAMVAGEALSACNFCSLAQIPVYQFSPSPLPIRLQISSHAFPKSLRFNSYKCSSRVRRSICAETAISDATTTPEIPSRSVSVILLAGGAGKRMGASMPKQYLPLLGQPIALYSFHTFVNMPQVKEIIVVCDPSYRDVFEDFSQGIAVPLHFALPGKERQDSVWSGLQEICAHSKLVCIHDSARPLVLSQDIEQVIKDGWVHGAAVLGVPVKATIKEAKDDLFVKRTLDRQTLWEMQTPQVVEPSLLKRGFDLVHREGLEVTDDVSIVEYLEHPVFITKGSYTNIKVTTPDDLLVAERILQGQKTLVGT